MAFLLPGYTQLRERPSRGIAEVLRQKEGSVSHHARVDAIQRSLLEQSPAADAPVFVALAMARSTLVSIHLPRGGLALAVFSDHVRAADYCDVLLGGDAVTGTAVVSAEGLLGLMRTNQRAFGGQLCLDRCPRCDVFGVSTFAEGTTARSILTLWAITIAQKRARLELYLEYATEAAGAGDWLRVKDIALETIGHVDPGDLRPHLLLARAASQLGDEILLDEAKRFLGFLSPMRDSSSGQQPPRESGATGAAHAASVADDDARTHTAPTVVARGTSPVAGPRSPSSPYAVGDLIDGVFRVKEIRSGGMGHVYVVEVDEAGISRAHLQHRLLSKIAGQSAGDRAGRLLDRRWFAIKTLQGSGLTSTAASERFERECLIWATLLPHPNIVRAFAAGRLGELTPYVLLEYVGGGSLRDRIRSRVAVADALAIALHVCRGMAFLQRTAGLVHRDIKPENILIGTDGVPRITDFGLVQIRQPRTGGEDALAARVVDLPLAEGASIAGSVPYMAPEQFLGASADVRSDVYSFGIVLYELFSGQRPFQCSSLAEYRQAHLHEYPRPIDQIVRLPGHSCELIMRCLAKEPSSRVADFAALAEQLAEVARGEGRADLVPEGVSAGAIQESMTASDWLGRGQALMSIGETLYLRNLSEDARPYLEGARSAFEQAASLEPPDLFERAAIGRVLHMIGDHEAAVPHLRAWTYTDSASADDHIHLAQSLVSLGRSEDARTVLEQATVRFPGDPRIELEMFRLSPREKASGAVSRDSVQVSRRAAASRGAWWKQFVATLRRWSSPLRPPRIEIALSGWNEEASHDDMRIWRDCHGNVLSGTVTGRPVPAFGEIELWGFCDRIATDNRAGLVEARSLWSDDHGPGLALIYKKRRDRGYLFTGILMISVDGTGQQWTVVAGEHGTKVGVREATITAELLNSGAMSRQEFDRVWARHPYDPDYPRNAPERLRFLSDAEEYDARFPDHPLTIIRSVLARLPQQLTVARRT